MLSKTTSEFCFDSRKIHQTIFLTPDYSPKRIETVIAGLLRDWRGSPEGCEDCL
jgi:hypothetical protein